MSLSPVAALVFFVLGVAVAIAGSLWPAVQALQVQAAVALKSGVDATDPRQRPRLRAAAVLLPLGALAALAPPVAGLPLFGYASIAIILAGGMPMGVVTSGSYCPTLEKSIAMGYVAPRAAFPGSELMVDIRGTPTPATVTTMPFYKRAK